MVLVANDATVRGPLLVFALLLHPLHLPVYVASGQDVSRGPVSRHMHGGSTFQTEARLGTETKWQRQTHHLSTDPVW